MCDRSEFRSDGGEGDIKTQESLKKSSATIAQLGIALHSRASKQIVRLSSQFF